MRSNPHRPPQTHPRGFTTPMVAAALLVVMLGFALVLDRLWLEAARLELTATAEAAALAAAGRLASDARLKEDRSSPSLLEDARNAAVDVALQNRVAGEPVVLDPAGDDIRFGHLVENTATGETPFLESEHLPLQVVVTAQRTRFRGNPVALFMTELTQQPAGDVVARAGAGLNNHLVAVRPFAGAPVPALPLAIWERDPTGRRFDTWEQCIEARRGRDDYAYDPRTHTVVRGSDGLPELTLKIGRRRNSPQDANALLIDVGSGFQSAKLRQQFERGWTVDDLEPRQGELRPPNTLLGLPQLEGSDRSDLELLIGVPRIALLYSTATPHGRGPTSELACERFVAIRVLDVTDQSDGSCEVIVQPTVLTTRTAVVATSSEELKATVPNPYIYRLQLTQ